MSRVSLAANFVTVTTDITGVATFTIKIPGTFGGLGEATSGRFLQQLEFWSMSGTNGDKISGMKITDTDGVVPSPVHASFPNYPDIVYFDDTAMSAGNQGFLINPTQPLILNPIGGAQFQFVPSGLYLTGKFTTANVVLIGQQAYVNVHWGILSNF